MSSSTNTKGRSAAMRSRMTSRARSSLIIAPLSSTIMIRSPTWSNRIPKAARDEATSSDSRCMPARTWARLWVAKQSDRKNDSHNRRMRFTHPRQSVVVPRQTRE